MIYEFCAQELDYKLLTDSYTYGCGNGLIEQIITGEYTNTNLIANPVPAGQILVAPAVTATNVQSNFSTIINTLPAKYRRSGGMWQKPRFLVAVNVYDAFEESLTYTAPQAAAGLSTTDPIVRTYRGFDIVPCDALSDNQILFTPPNNIVITFDLESDATNLLIRNGDADSTLCYTTNWRMDWRSYAFFGLGEALVASL